MSVQDFISGTVSRIEDDDEDLEDVLLDTIAEFAAGATARLWWAGVQLRGGIMSSEYADSEVRFVADSVMDVRRADTLLDERPVAEWLFDGDCSGELCWDVGGYHGHWSSIAIQQGCDVRVFEPAATNRRRLIRNLELNGVGTGHDRLIVDDRALSDAERDGWLRGRSESELSVTDGDGGRQPTTTVPGDSITELPDRIKIDVEGHEHRVLLGMMETLNYVDRIVIEVHQGESLEQIEGVLRDAGLKTYEIPTHRSQTYIGGWRS